MASMCALKAIEAGVDIVDTVLAPFGLRTSHPAIEPLVVTLEGTPWETNLDLDLLFRLGAHLEAIAPKYKDLFDTSRVSVIDTNVLKHQIPGGMASNLANQLKEANALDRIDEVYAELPKTRKDLGTPPLVTPTSQIVGVQAVLNVLFGRYKMITNQVKDICFGLYGKTPTEINPEVRAKALKGYSRGETPITGRPGDFLEPELEQVREEGGDLIKNDEDLLIWALYPTTGKEFLQRKYEKA
jgi:pyruvate/oxaloacetate carboxyltransferase